MRLKPLRSTLVSVLFNCSCFVYHSHCMFRSPFVFCAAASCCFNSPTSPLGSIKFHLIYLWPQRDLFLFVCSFTCSRFALSIFSHWRSSAALIAWVNLQNPGLGPLGIHRFHLTEGKYIETSPSAPLLRSPNPLPSSSSILPFRNWKAGVTGLAFI